MRQKLLLLLLKYCPIPEEIQRIPKMMTPMENVAVVLIALVLQFAKKSKEPPAGDPEPFDKLYFVIP